MTDEKLEIVDDSELENSKSVYIFGRDISQIPCFRNSFLYGIGSGLGSGLAYFMFTSNVRYASHCGMGFFMMVTMGYWTTCRYNYSKLKFEMAQLREGLQNKALYEGSLVEEEMEKAAIQSGLDIKSV